MQNSIQALASQLASSDSKRAQKEACAELKTLCFDDDHFQSIRDTDAIQALVGALASPHMELTELSADCIWSLSADPENHNPIINASALVLLARCLTSNSPSLAATAAASIMNLVAIGDGIPQEARKELLEADGIKGLVRLLHSEGALCDQQSTKEASLAVATALSMLAIDPQVGEEIRKTGGVGSLVPMLRQGANSELARHAAAILGRMAHNNLTSQQAIRDAGGVSALLELGAEAMHGQVEWRAPAGDGLSNAQQQAAQHSAAALWTLATEPESRKEILYHGRGLEILASMIGGRAGEKAEGNAAGALLALLPAPGETDDPNTVLALFGEMYSALRSLAVDAAAPAA